MDEKRIVKIAETSIAEQFEFAKYAPAQLANKIKTLVSNGKSLNDQEAIALATFSMANRLNPFMSECYFMPSVGPTVGIAGYRRRGQEQYRKELIIAGRQQAQYSVSFEPATHDEAQFDEGAGDIAWKAILNDPTARGDYLGNAILKAKELEKLGVPNPYEEAKAMLGRPPEWWAVGVVYGSETFSGVVYENNHPTDKRKPEMWDRNERAKKRAEKNVLKMRFSNMSFEGEVFFDGEVTVSEVKEYEAEQHEKYGGTNEEILGKLYPEETFVETAAEDGNFVEEDFLKELDDCKNWKEFHLACNNLGVPDDIATAVATETKDLDKAKKAIVGHIPPK